MSALQRLWRFCRQWIPTLAWSQSVTGRILRIFLLLFGLSKAVLPWFGVTMPVAFIVEISLKSASSGELWFHRGVSIDIILAAILVVILMAGTAALAWFKTSGPRLIVAHDLEEDTVARVYRLLVHVEGYGKSKPQAFVDMFSEDSTPLQVSGGRAAIELQWTHYPPGHVPEMTRSTPRQSIGIVYAPEPNKLIVHGNIHHPEIETLQHGQPKKIYLRITVHDQNDQEPVVRWLSFIPDPTAPMFHQAVPEEPPWFHATLAKTSAQY